MPLELLSAPQASPVTLTDLIDGLRVLENDDNERLTRLLAGAVRQTESYLRRSLIKQTWRLSADAFCSGDVELPRGNLIGVTEVKYLDPDNVEQTVSPTVYEADTRHVPGRVRLAYEQSWPATINRKNAVWYDFESGFGDTADAVPEDIQESLIMQVEARYDRGDGFLTEDSGGVSRRLSAAWDLIAHYRLGVPGGQQ